jgi:flagellar hook protein FlgE
MFSAVSGMRAHQTKMDVVGNNIANVNTVGFKGSQTVFEDTLSQVMRNGSAATAELGGTNPAQVGLGVRTAGTTTNWSQGSTQNTGRTTDFLISGDGFFVVSTGSEKLYTRAGSFDFDGAGNLVNPDGAILQGWRADANGVVNPNGPIDDLRIPIGQVMAPVATSGGAVTGNLPATAAVGSPAIQTAITMYDGQGNAHQVSYSFAKTAAGWDMSVIDENNNTLGTQGLTFDSSGNLNGPTSMSFTPGASFPGWPGPVTIDLTGLSQYGGKNTAAAQTTLASGSAMGTLQSFTLGNDGTITGVYSNGLRRAIGQLAMASFANPGGLTKAGNSTYRIGDNSGVPNVGQAGSGGRGTLSAGALEMSNVDLAEEFSNLIVAQRGFQANSRVITASDEILQDLVNLKR